MDTDSKHLYCNCFFFDPDNPVHDETKYPAGKKVGIPQEWLFESSEEFMEWILHMNTIINSGKAITEVDYANFALPVLYKDVDDEKKLIARTIGCDEETLENIIKKNGHKGYGNYRQKIRNKVGTMLDKLRTEEGKKLVKLIGWYEQYFRQEQTKDYVREYFQNIINTDATNPDGDTSEKNKKRRVAEGGVFIQLPSEAFFEPIENKTSKDSGYTSTTSSSRSTTSSQSFVHRLTENQAKDFCALYDKQEDELVSLKIENATLKIQVQELNAKLHVEQARYGVLQETTATVFSKWKNGEPFVYSSSNIPTGKGIGKKGNRMETMRRMLYEEEEEEEEEEEQ